MSLTEQQKAYHLRKARTHLANLDANKDGSICREDYELISKRMAEYGNFTKEQAEEVEVGYLKIADQLQLTEGVEIPLKHFIPQYSELLLSKSPEERKGMIRLVHGPVFAIIDTNNDGHISPKEFRIYLKAMAPDVTDEEAKHAFETIDINKNGEISEEEFYAAAEDFLFGVEETEISKAFVGKLLD